MPFFDLEKTETPPDFDAVSSGKLANRLRKKYKRPINTTKWAEAFRTLRRRKGLPEQRVGEVLDWALSNLETLPLVNSPKSFFQHFSEIADQYDLKGTVESEEALKTARWIRGAYWPAFLRPSLGKLCEITLRRYRPVYETTLALVSQERSQKTRGEQPADRTQGPLRPTHLVQFLGWLLDSYRLCDPLDFCERWLTSTSGWLESFPGWQGEPMSLAFSMTSKRMKRLVAEWETDWGMPGEDFWTQWMDTLHESSKAQRIG